tara:strand:- start:3 stop:653 length:651 start_codon:yes stop_codon:yes gene_type:complete
MAKFRHITEFKSTLKGGGSRPNLFEVELNFPNGTNQTLNFVDSTSTDPTADTQTISTTDIANQVPFLVKAANLPASNITPVEVPFRGRILKVAGERTFDTWTVTVLNDTDFKIRTAMEQWMNGISRLSNGSGETNPASYTANADVTQLGRNGGTLRQYNFKGLFPTNISEIALSMDTTDTIEEFTVEFQVLYWEVAEIKGNEDKDGNTSVVAPGIQ